MSFELFTRVRLIVIKHLAISLNDWVNKLVIKILRTRATRKEENSYCCRRGARTRGAQHETSSVRFVRTDRSAGEYTQSTVQRDIYTGAIQSIYNDMCVYYNIVIHNRIIVFLEGWDRGECTTRMLQVEYPRWVGTRTAEQGNGCLWVAKHKCYILIQSVYTS